MRKFSNHWLWGGLLVLVGIILLGQNLAIFRSEFISFVWGVILGAAGLVFLSVVIADRRQWWAAIPGLILVYLAALIILGQFLPAQITRFGGSFFLAAIGISFWIVYFLNFANWWAIIPGGVLLTLAVVSLIENAVTGLASGGIFFLGLGLTFALLSIVNTPNGKMRWPLIPAGILLAIGLLISLAASSILNYIWPIVLILIGLYLLFFRKSPKR
ncbi:MAG: hypothetical protein M1281_06500 [Chloroflexi bacterium]|nr:hypothetical protein [Chloroflexota bacterium]